MIDVANLLKAFFRDLPEPLLPYFYHEVLLRSMLLTNGSKIEALFLLCLLLPAEHLNTLAYFMQVCVVDLTAFLILIVNIKKRVLFKLFCVLNSFYS